MQPVETGKCVGNVVRASKSSDRACGSVKHRLYRVGDDQIVRYFDESCITVIQATHNEQDSQCLVNRRRDGAPDTAQLAQGSKTISCSPLNMHPHGQISIEKNTKITQTARWADEVSADPKWNTRQLRLSTSCCTFMGELAFSYSGPLAWNALLSTLCFIADRTRFRKLLKIYFFDLFVMHVWTCM